MTLDPFSLLPSWDGNVKCATAPSGMPRLSFDTRARSSTGSARLSSRSNASSDRLKEVRRRSRSICQHGTSRIWNERSKFSAPPNRNPRHGRFQAPVINESVGGFGAWPLRSQSTDGMQKIPQHLTARRRPVRSTDASRPRESRNSSSSFYPVSSLNPRSTDSRADFCFTL